MDISRVFLTFEPVDTAEWAVMAKFLEAVLVSPDSEDQRLEDGQKAQLLKGMPEPAREFMKAAEAMVKKSREERMIVARSVICNTPEEVAEVFKQAKEAFMEIQRLERTGMRTFESSTWGRV